MANSCTVCLTFDFDAISSHLIRGETTPTFISRGEYGARIGVPRILALLAEHTIPATFFVPGHTCETFPERCKEIAAAGHEFAHHGYCHEVPSTLSREQESAILTRGSDAIEKVAGKRPVGYRSPSWDLSANSLALLIDAGFHYDSSLMADDFLPYLCRTGDEGGTENAYRFGNATSLVQMPVSWVLDDYPIFEWNAARGSGLASPAAVEDTWREEFDYMYEQVPNGVYTLTMHPKVIGRGHRMRMLDRLIRHMRGRPGVQFARLGDVAEAVRPTLLDAAGL
jgi:peptidoglycan-N-acetylglucosamine deacetylase